MFRYCGRAATACAISRYGWKSARTARSYQTIDNANLVCEANQEPIGTFMRRPRATELQKRLEVHSRLQEDSVQEPRRVGPNPAGATPPTRWRTDRLARQRVEEPTNP
jgi:hypothetical protein